MALLETLTINLGAALAKAAAKLWLKDRPFAEAASGALTDVFKKKLEDFSTRDATEQVFERVKRDLAKRLNEYLHREFSGAPENDLEAAVLAVAGAFEQTSLADILRDDVDAARIKRMIDPGPLSRFEILGSPAAEAAQQLLTMSCRYVVTFVAALPSFQLEATKALLQRDRQILEDVSAALEAVDELHRRVVENDRRDGSRFEPNYRFHVVRKLDRMQMFGLAYVGAGAREYPLSVAYVTLSTTARGESQPSTVNRALAGHQFVLIRGEAGSGKTTLLQWLAVRAAGKDFAEPLSSWNHRIPFYLRLRDFAKITLPHPEEFLASTAPNLVGEMPNGWCHQVLNDNALVLIDGVDELPSDRRREFLDWLRDLKEHFPKAIIVVSSRPATLDAPHPPMLGSELESGLAFMSLRLEPMTLSDSHALVAQWHRAVGRDKPDEINPLEQYEKELHKTLNDRAAIRNLAANPLLCAMICVLNWHHQKQLPDDRMELYRLALELLLERREQERAIGAVHLSGFDRKDRETILDDLGYWMLRNGLSEAPRQDAEAQVAISLKRMGRLTHATPEGVLQELLERSGVIRQPEAGVVDFVHRTFLEYMGARSALAAGDIDALVQKASEESWREAIVFACGHASGKERDRLVRRLLGIPEPGLKGHLTALFKNKRSLEAEVTAACCLETAARSLDSALLAELRQRAARLFPPRDIATAMLLKPAAEMDPALLRGHAGAGEQAAAACIRVAAAIGGQRMLDVIASYSDITGHQVDVEIARAWDYFDDTGYFESVVSKRPALLGVSAAELDREAVACVRLLGIAGKLHDPTISLGEVVTGMRKDGKLDLIFSNTNSSTLHPPGIAEVARERALPKGGSIYLRQLRDLRNLSLSTSDSEVVDAVGSLQQLCALRLNVYPGVRLEPISRLQHLKELSIFGEGVKDLRGLLKQLRLERLHVGNAPINSPQALPVPFSVWDLELEYLGALGSLEWIGDLPNIEKLGICGIDAPINEWLERLTKLKTLTIKHPKGPVTPDWSALRLEHAVLHRVPASFLSGVEQSTTLRKLLITTSGLPRFFRPPPQLTELTLVAEDVGVTVDCGDWSHDSQFERIHLIGMDRVLNADRLAELPALKMVKITRARSVEWSPQAREKLARHALLIDAQ